MVHTMKVIMHIGAYFRNRWMHDKQYSNEEVSVFHKGGQTMVAFKGSKSAEEWLMTDRHIVFGLWIRMRGSWVVPYMQLLFLPPAQITNTATLDIVWVVA